MMSELDEDYWADVVRGIVDPRLSRGLSDYEGWAEDIG
jgi:hypothetical protein